MKLRVIASVILALSCLCSPQLHAGTEIAVVVNKACAVSSLNKAQLSAIYRAKTTEFPNGSTVNAVKSSSGQSHSSRLRQGGPSECHPTR
ncbi:MAG: hypothetical protein QM784_27010 [Polyangiaceae bacterium]